MDLEKQTVKMTIRKIVKYKSYIRPSLYDLYFTVPSFDPKSMSYKKALLFA